MKEKIEKMFKRLEELEQALSQKDVFNDQKRYKELSREHRELTKIMEVGKPYLKAVSDYEGNLSIIHDGSDPELAELAELENEELEEQIRD
ncbi:MAG TPA: PCRF domain-containing protein, partial [Calditrichaeota bacterium]|nr:PCRF domain-containing protein [Calditrichota bacterium]